LLALAVSASSALAEEDDQYYKDRKKVEKATPAFDPAYFKDGEMSHYVIFVDVIGGKLVLSDKPAQIRPGKMPHRAKTSRAPLRITYLADGKALGSYTVRDPFMVDSYDPVDGPKEGVITPMRKGVVEILLPYQPGIQSVRISRNEKTLSELDVTEKLKKAQKPKIVRKKPD
jgi:hypothetical protein